MLMPSHAKIVQPYRDPQPLFAKHGVEAQLDAMFSNHRDAEIRRLPGHQPDRGAGLHRRELGPLDPRAQHRGHGLQTNLEAAEEIARQLRLRDLAGLIVIDFIDMEEKRNNRTVEKKLNECLKNDRARIQVGRISPFGLLEMSRQRIRTGVLESSSIPCAHCAGTGFVRSTPSVALHVLRSIEETLIKNAGYNLVVRTRMEAAFYILNQKRVHLRELETRFGVAISIVADDSLTGTTNYAIERGEPALRIEHKAPATGVQIDAIPPADEAGEADLEIEEEIEGEAEATEESGAEARSDEERDEEGDGTGRRRRRRRRRRGRDRDASGTEIEGDETVSNRRSRRRGSDEDEAGAEATGSPRDGRSGRIRGAQRPPPSPRPSRRSRPRSRGRRREPFRRGQRYFRRDGSRRRLGGESPSGTRDEAPAAEPGTPRPPAAPRSARCPSSSRSRSRRSRSPHRLPAPPEPEPEPVAVVLTPPDPDRPKRAGWWSKAKSVISGH